MIFAAEGALLSFVCQILRDANAADLNVPYTLRYVCAVVFVCAATGLKLLAFPDIERLLPFTFFYSAIAASAWIGGFGPGLAAILLSSLSAAFFFLAPRYSLALTSRLDLIRLGFFAIEGVMIASLTAAYPRARRLAERALEHVREYSEKVRRSIEDVRALRMTSRDLVWEWKPAANQFILGATEIERPEASVVSMTFSLWLHRIHPEDRPAVLASLKSALHGNSDEWVCEYRKRRPGGMLRNICDHAYIIRDAGGHPVRVIGRSVDVTETRDLVRAAAMNRQYHAVFEQSPVAILLVDKLFHIIHANRAASAVLGYSADALISMPAENLFAVDRRPKIIEALVNLPVSGHSSVALNAHCVRANEEVFEAEINAAAISPLEDGSAALVIVIEEKLR